MRKMMHNAKSMYAAATAVEASACACSAMNIAAYLGAVMASIFVSLALLGSLRVALLALISLLALLGLLLVLALLWNTANRPRDIQPIFA